MRHALLQSLSSTPGDAPDAAVPVINSDGAQLAVAPASGVRITWFGHSSTLVELDGIKLLTDPIWSERPSPVTWAGPQRWFAPPLALANLPKIDAVLISHDHYDHLDRATIVALKDSGAVFVVPLGIGAHLAYWGIPEARIIELDWWQTATVKGVDVVATPARHASGRLNPQSGQTLWSGYALVGPQHRVYYSGDTGYHAEMPEIGRRLGPFDVTLIEAGQYDADWPDWHLGPEQAVMTHLAVRGKVMIPVHWGLFKLAHHGWTEPVERVLAAARCGGATVLTPQPGQSVEPATQAPIPQWWPAQPWHSAQQRPIVATVDGAPSWRYPPQACGS